MRRDTWPILALSLVLAGGTARADVWDVQTDNDNTTGTDNEVVHGTSQRHDLGALPGPLPDQDWFLVSSRGRRSYEFIVDSTSGDIGPGLSVARFAVDGTTLLQGASVIGFGNSLSLRWQNTTGGAVLEFIRVISNVCQTTCGADDVYDMRFRETTVAVPRFNNASGQVTVLIIQNDAENIANGNVYFRNAAGMLLATQPFGPLAAGGALVLNTAGVPGAAGVSGTLTISHDARFGDLAVKSVALEPSTGFSFDTPGMYRPF